MFATSLSPVAPFIPVKVFAFFVLTNRAFTKCLLIFKFQFMLAEVTFEVVYIAAKLAPSGKYAKNKSSRPSPYKSADTEEISKPSIGCNS